MANERILVADDDPQIVSLCVQLLSEQGYQVRGVTSGQQAIACLETEPFDLLVTDIRMPDVDGLMLLRRSLALDPDLTVVMITGYATLGRVIEALNSGARGFLLKPFGIEEFDQAIESALAQRQKEQEWVRLRAQLPILLISQALMTEADLSELSGRLLEVVARQMGAHRALLLLLDQVDGVDATGTVDERQFRRPAAEELYVAATVGLPEEAVVGQRVAVANEVVRQTLSAEEVLVGDTGSLDGLEMPFRALVSGPAAELLALVPLHTGKKEVGILGLSLLASSQRAAPLTPSDLSLLWIMGGQIAIALENARLYASEQRRRTELAHALEQQRELDRLKNEFIQNVSHELRTPLAMVLGYAELLAGGELGEVRTEQQGPLEIIVQRSYVLRDLISNITAILENEIRVPIREPVKLADLAIESLEDFQVLASKAGLKLSADLSAHVPPVLGDEEHLRRVVDNLIGNAVKFTPAGGTITVSLRHVDGEVVLRVEDTGVGIAAEHQERIFERFYQVDGSTRRTHGGCGLGLALVREIVERHGGRVAIESGLGQGSTFTVALPAAATPEQPWAD